MQNKNILNQWFDNSSLNELKRMFQVVEQSPSSIIVTDYDGVIEYVNPKYTQLTGYSVEESVGQYTSILKTELTPKDTYRELWKTIKAGETWRGEFVNHKKNGEIYYEFAAISPIYNSKNQITHFMAIKEDITERRKVEMALREANEKLKVQMLEIQELHKKLEEQATKDSMTGLYNQHFLQESLTREINFAKRKKLTLGVMMIDIDHFKEVNDSYGHNAGNQVLKELANMITSSIRKEDIPCRYGGDELLIIMPDISIENICKRADMLCKKISSYNIFYDDHVIITTISVGVAVETHEALSKDILEKVDRALYQAKLNGRNQFYAINSY